MSRLITISLLFVFSSLCFAQFETATVLGTVKDSTGAVIAGGKITLESVDTGVLKTAQANETGNFEFINVAIGTYHVKAEANGFKTAVTDNFTVTVSARQRVDIILSIGDMTQTVTVQDAASTLETESSDRGQVINNVTVDNQPLHCG